jgi:protein-L-isoaspartate(D-aspartate) O-methyltransferase
MAASRNGDPLAKGRQRMLEQDLRGRGITDLGVLKAMAEIPREEFVSEAYKSQAYADRPLPIGLDQTISQPYIVALMTQELRLDCDCEVLEIGTGSGYQTAVLSWLVKKVHTIERFSQLSESAQAVLRRLGISNVEFHVGDGSCGWPESRLPAAGCFDRIIVTAVVPEIAEPLLKQLAEDGLIVIPVGYGALQDLVVGQKKKGTLVERLVCTCRFVKLIGKYAFEE